MTGELSLAVVNTLLMQRIHHQQAVTFRNWLPRSRWQDPLPRLDITIVMETSLAAIILTVILVIIMAQCVRISRRL